MKDGFIKVSAVTPKIKVGAVDYNAQQIITECKKASAQGAKIVVTPELCLTGATAGDLFKFETVKQAVLRALMDIKSTLSEEDALFLIGAPLAFEGAIYSCAVAINCGEIIQIIPSLNPTKEQKRYFTGEPTFATVALDGEEVEFSSALLTCEENPDITVEVTFNENAPIYNSTIVANMASGAKTYKRDYGIDDILFGISRSKAVAIIRAENGWGESVTDGVYYARNQVIENGELLAIGAEDETVISEVDAGYLAYKKSEPTDTDYTVAFSVSDDDTSLTREIESLPFCDYGATDAITLQARALASRMQGVGAKTAVIGLSGGLDSTLALLVTEKAFDLLGWDKKNIIAVTMPCFGTTKRTKSNAQKLAECTGVTFKTVNITESVKRHLRDIGHDLTTTDITYENAQARERTQVLMDLANMHGGMVIGTGDMSELALGWATYNGDHMSMYSVNAGVPKTMVRWLVSEEAEIRGGKLGKVLYDILDTPVSPELLPCKDGEITQVTEDLVGPYELHDFFLYGLLERGNGAGKLYRTAKYAFEGKYDDKTIEKWLRVFIKRFFSQQFKRSCSPDGPQVTEVSLSPRKSLLLPTDIKCDAFIAELDERIKEN